MSAQDKSASSRRGQALAGALAGVAVIAVLVAVFIGIQVSDSDDKSAASAYATPTPTAAAPTDPAAAPPSEPVGAPSQPAPAQAQPDPALLKKPVVKAGEGKVADLVVKELVAGKGPKVQPGQTIVANYVGVTYVDGKEFDSSWASGQPAQFPVGVGNLIEGWDKGLIGVAVGSRVQLDIPAAMAYGDQAAGGRPSGDLRFVVDILAAQ